MVFSFVRPPTSSLGHGSVCLHQGSKSLLLGMLHTNSLETWGNATEVATQTTAFSQQWIVEQSQGRGTNRARG